VLTLFLIDVASASPEKGAPRIWAQESTERKPHFQSATLVRYSTWPKKGPADYNARSRYLRNDSIIKNDSASSVKQWFVVTLQHLDIVRNSLGQMWITGRSDTFANQAGYVIWGAWIAAITSS